MSEPKIKTIYLDEECCAGEAQEFASYLKERFPDANIYHEVAPKYWVLFEDGSEDEMGEEEYNRFCNSLWYDYCKS